MRTEIITHIKATYSSLSKSEQKVADFILENLNRISYISVSEVAMKAEVGEATVLRCCKKLGYNGFQGLKKEIIEILREDNKKVLKEESKDIVYDKMQTMLNHTLNVQSKDVIKRVSKMIVKANNIYIFGLGLSNLSAKAAEIRLSFLGYNAFSFDENHIQLLKANLSKKGDLVIGLSVSGESLETIKNVSIAKKAGAKVIGITNYNPSTLANLSDELILSASKDVVDTGTTLVTLTSQIFIIEQLCNELINIDKDNIISQREKILDTYD
ncbi:MurR/RpiR family transcriptional regulator [Clostridium chrysemydis]|uniref:MurR/RpiR family transcriptional regulator n=1 Tax=Clostridium chrysemydis TaxID=2665504 RepID=UPI003F3ED23B